MKCLLEILQLIFFLIILSSLREIFGSEKNILSKESCNRERDYRQDVTFLMNRMNKELLFLRRAHSDIEWELETSPSIKTFELNAAISEFQIIWRDEWCSKFRNLNGILQCSHERMIKFLCRGPIYSPNLARKISAINKKLSTAYSSTKVCKMDQIEIQCFHGEPDLGKFMATCRNETELFVMWKSWQNEMSLVKKIFTESVVLQNSGARNNDYHDIGECWREELEDSDLQNLVKNLYDEVEPLYKLLHAVVRYKLAKMYPEVVHPKRPIPSHLLGNLWSQNWGSLIDILLPKAHIPNITESMKTRNYTVPKMAKKAEDFYLSLGFPPLPKTFWEKSIFERRNDNMNCHASAANMYIDDDFRLSIVHHEMGHVQYYMAYKNQPTIFQGAPNSAFHEAIGDALLLGVMTSQNLQRLGLVNDSLLTNNFPILLKEALSKIPQLPHSLIIDKWRWEVFSGKIKPPNYNRSWWKFYRHYMGIEPPIPRSEIYFDPAAVFYITENVPHIKYFLANILRVQIFESICEATVTGRINNSNFSLPLHQCDIYGSDIAGRRLRSMMKLGSSVNWKYALFLMTGSSNYKTKPLLKFYEPVHKWLQQQVNRYNIYVGW